MRIPVLIEPLPNRGFRATGPSVGLSAEGSTSDEARERLESLLRERLSAGVELSWIEAAEPSAAPHRLARHAGTWSDDPLYDEYQDAVEEYRRSRDAEDAP